MTTQSVSVSTQIKCPHCNKLFEPSEAYKHELEERLLQGEQLKHQEEIQKLKLLNKEIFESKEKEVEDAKRKAVESVREEVEGKVNQELKDKEDQIESLKKRAEEAEEEELKIRKEKRELEESKKKFELEKQRQMDEEREKIRVDAKKEAEDGMLLTLAQEKKRNEDAQKQILELQRKLQQGSQQAQGEVMELELEALLKREFPLDKITEVKKGQRGADVVQEVIDDQGRECGVILWESKNAKWSPAWIAILKENQRQAKAQIAVL